MTEKIAFWNKEKLIEFLLKTYTVELLYIKDKSHEDIRHRCVHWGYDNVVWHFKSPIYYKIFNNKRSFYRFGIADLRKYQQQIEKITADIDGLNIEIKKINIDNAIKYLTFQHFIIIFEHKMLALIEIIKRQEENKKQNIDKDIRLEDMINNARIYLNTANTNGKYITFKDISNLLLDNLLRRSDTPQKYKTIFADSYKTLQPLLKDIISKRSDFYHTNKLTDLLIDSKKDIEQEIDRAIDDCKLFKEKLEKIQKLFFNNK